MTLIDPLTLEAASEDQLSLVSVPLDLPPVDQSLAAEHGEVFTRSWVVELILDLCGYTPDKDLGSMTIVEPSCGSGAFLGPMVERLVASAQIHHRDLNSCESAIRASDLLDRNVELSRTRIQELLERLSSISISRSQELADAWVAQADFLLTPPHEGSADFVVGNPPYIRSEAIPSARNKAYRLACPTMGGRADIYIGFYEKGLRALKPHGILGFICADRWMRNAYGSKLRKMISSRWSVESIVHMTGVDAFEDEVDAYPSITTIRRGPQEDGPLVVDACRDFGPSTTQEVVELNQDKNVGTKNEPTYSSARLSTWFDGAGGWPTASPERLVLIADLETRFPNLEDERTGTKVGIGVATGADKIFIVDGDPPGVEAERLLPLAMVRNIQDGSVNWGGKKLVNPWSQEGLVSTEDWPGMTAYLEPHKIALSDRHTAKSGKWHKTIDRVIEGLVDRPKLYLPDFKESIFPVLDEGGTYPHHNLYWVISDSWDLRVLGGLLLSDISNMFIEAYSVRMRGGYLRFQAQYLRRICLPNISDVSSEAASSLAEAFESRDRKAATQAALPLYGLKVLPA